MAKSRALASILFLIPLVVRANPVAIDGSAAIAFGVVAIFAFVVESGIAALILLFFGLAPLRLFFAYFILNAAVFGLIFNPLLNNGLPWQLAEVIVVAVDCLVIKGLTHCENFQGDDFEGVPLKRALFVSIAVNACSFFVGAIASGTPWEEKPGFGD